MTRTSPGALGFQQMLDRLNKLPLYPIVMGETVTFQHGVYFVEITRRKSSCYIAEVVIQLGHHDNGLPNCEKHHGIVSTWDEAKRFAFRKLRESAAAHAEAS